MKISSTLLARFTRHTSWGGDCLFWTGYVGPNGYGYMSIASGISRGPHHVAWFLRYGVWPERLRHTCDNRLCCNTEHLLEGTQAQNMADKVARGRQALGEGHGMTKVSLVDVLEMRRLRAEGVTLSVLASRFGTCQSNVSAICNRLTRAVA